MTDKYSSILFISIFIEHTSSLSFIITKVTNSTNFLAINVTNKFIFSNEIYWLSRNASNRNLLFSNNVISMFLINSDFMMFSKLVITINVTIKILIPFYRININMFVICISFCKLSSFISSFTSNSIFGKKIININIKTISTFVLSHIIFSKFPSYGCL